MDFKPDLEQAKRFLNTLDPGADCRELLDGLPDGFTFQTFDDVKGRKTPGAARIINNTLDAAAPVLASLNAKGAGVFVTMNETDGKGRKLANIIRVRALWIEDDEGLGIPTPLEPHLVSQTSPGKQHKIFLVDGLSQEHHQAIQEILISQYGSDKDAKDVTRVLRVPGFYHNKKDPFMVQLIHESGAAPFTAEQVLSAFKFDGSMAIPREKRVKESTKPLTKLSDDPDEYTPIDEVDLKLPLPDISLENAAKYLPEAGNQSRSEWLKIGMALHHQFSGSDDGLSLFDTWSQGVREYQGFEDVAATWYSLRGNTGANTTTFKSLVQDYNKKNVQETAAQRNKAALKAEKLLSECDDPMILIDDIAPKLHRLAAKNVVLEKDFAAALIARYTQLRPGETLTKPEAFRAMKVRRSKTHVDSGCVAGDMINSEAPDWAKEWVWVSEDECFMSTETRVRLTTNGFKGHYNSKLQKTETDDKDAASYLRDNSLIPKVMRSMFAPSLPRIFEHEGVWHVNTYTANSRVTVPDEVVNQDAVVLFKTHLELVCGGWNREAHLLANFLATCTQPKPVKVRWAPLLIGVPGDGKTIFFSLVAHAIGLRNATTVNGNTIASSATSGMSGWAEGSLFTMIEEMKLHGHNRFDAMNMLKPYITNDVIPIRNLYKEVRTVPNTTNYFLVSNYVDGTPVEEGDRRFMVLKSLFPLEKQNPDYFEKLVWAIRNQTGCIVRWLWDLPIHEDYYPDRPAPMTSAKKNVIKLSGDDMREQVENILDDENNAFYNRTVVCFDPLVKRVFETSNGSIRLDQAIFKVSKALSAIGFTKLDRVRIDGDRQSLWGCRTDGLPATTKWAKKFIVGRIAEDMAPEKILDFI